MRSDPEVLKAVSQYQFGILKIPTAGQSGELLGRGAGSSLEFQEYREYLPGDDIRHLDWSAYARTDSLMVRLYREEISPQTDILLDASSSMRSGSGLKSLVAAQLGTLFVMLNAQLGGRPELVLLDDSRPLRKLHLNDIESLNQNVFQGTTTLVELMQENRLQLKKQSLRIVISDFLFPHNPQTLLKHLASESGILWVVQLLHAWEDEPTVMGGRRLIDLETTQEADLIIDEVRIEEYLARLRRLQAELVRCAQQFHAVYVKVIAEKGLDLICREDLCQAGILRPAS